MNAPRSASWLRLLAALLTVTGAALVTACSSSPAEGEHTHGATTACAQDPRANTYVANLEAKTVEGSLVVRFLDARPAPPDKGTNEWSVQLLDAATSAPVKGASVQVVLFMPDHGHGSAVKPVVAPGGADGTYAVSKVYFAMAGLWKVTFVVTLATGETREASFSFCVEG